ncbi:MAG: hypothetical protein IPN77_31900 [Sandaracinaceae bacterium]|nr:hypothetical protein [Sandaracinaceae bacterium]
MTSEKFEPPGTGCNDWTRYATVRVSPTTSGWSCDNYQITLSGREYDPW